MASYAGYARSLASTSRSSFTYKFQRAGGEGSKYGDDILDQRSSLEYGIFGVLFTLSKERSETRIRARWAFLKILLDGWQLFCTVISPARQGWSIDQNGGAWAVIGVLNFTWLSDLGYGAYLAVLYSMLALLAVNVAMCVWVAWCFKEHKFPVVWPIKVLRVFSSLFFQAFDVTSLNLLQLGLSCRFTGPVRPHLRFSLLPQYSCTASPHIVHAIVSAVCLVLFVSIALLLNMAEVEVNPLSRRPLALGHSGADVLSFAVKVLLTLVNVFFGWTRVEASLYLVLSLALAWLTLKWNSNLVAWMNHLKGGVSATTVWCSAVLMMLVFRSGGHDDPVQKKKWADSMTLLLLGGLAPAFGAGALISWGVIRYKTASALKALKNPRKLPLMDAFHCVDEPRDIEMAARCCRVWKDSVTPDPEAVNNAHQIIKAGAEMFPQSAYMVLLHGNFMIDVLGIRQSGSRRIEEARKLNPSLMCRFIMFVRQQQATQNAAESNVNSSSRMDLLGYVEYQSKQRMVVRLHKEALQAMCSFWKALDASQVSFTHLSKALGRIERSVSQAQRAYQVVLENYGSNPKLVYLYGKFLQTVKNDPWRAAAYISESERLEELQAGQASGPLMPDGTPLSRMDDLATAVLVVDSAGEVQMVNKHAHVLFGYKRGALEGMPLTALFAPQFTQLLGERLAALTALDNESDTNPGKPSSGGPLEELVVGLHYDRLAFHASLVLHKVTGIGEDSTLVAIVEPLPPAKGVASLWVTQSGLITACDVSFIAHFGWKAPEVNGVNIQGLVSCPAANGDAAAAPNSSSKGTAVRATGGVNVLMARLLAHSVQLAAAAGSSSSENTLERPNGLACLVPHKYMQTTVACEAKLAVNGPASSNNAAVPTVYELQIRITSETVQLLAVNRKGHIVYVSPEVATCLVHGHSDADDPTAPPPWCYGSSSRLEGIAGGGGLKNLAAAAAGPTPDSLAGYTLMDFLSPAWRDMHTKLIRDTVPSSTQVASQPACRKSSMLPGPTLEMRSAGGKELYMRVGVSTSEVGGEMMHLVRLERSSLDAALAEKRLRLLLSPDGLISEVAAGDPMQLFGIDTSKLLGRGLWDVLKGLPPAADDRPCTAGPHALTRFIDRCHMYPGHSWRVKVASPAPPRDSGWMMSTAAPCHAEQQTKEAVIQIEPLAGSAIYNKQATSSGDERSRGGGLFVDLWPISSVAGVLQLDSYGRIQSVLEERTRPVGLLFGVPSQSLVGNMLGELVALPRGVSKPEDLLFASTFKKSSLKARPHEARVKVGPVHVVRATHQDGAPLNLALQVVGKPCSNESVTALLKVHQPPMMPKRQLFAPPFPRTTAAEDTCSPRSPELLLSEAAAGGPRLLATAADAAPPSAAVVAVTVTAAYGRGLERPPSVCSLSTPPAAASRASRLDSGSPTTMEPPPAFQQAGQPHAPSDLDPEPAAAAAAVQLAGRSKLAGMVRSLGECKPASSDCSFGARSIKESGRRQQATAEDPATTSPQKSVLEECRLERLDLPGTVATGYTPPSDAEVLLVHDMGSGRAFCGPRDDDKLPQEKSIRNLANGRISKWVASEGAFYQNSDQHASDACNRLPVNGGDDQPGVSRPSDGKGQRINTPPSPSPLKRDEKFELDPQLLAAATVVSNKIRRSSSENSEDDQQMAAAAGYNPGDDAGSDAGQSAVSGSPSATGSEYTRGKRVRKLTKLMDSSEVQQVQKRLRIHALITVAILAVAHIVCFMLTVLAVKSQRSAMLQLGNSVLAQQHMQRVMIHVRSLDNIATGKWRPNVYTPQDAPYFLNRVGYHAEEAMARIIDILTEHSGASAVADLLYNSKKTVWDYNDANGSDVYTNLTILDFGTRFYIMAKNIEQYHDSWVTSGIRIANTPPGQFLLKSGPDFFGEFRKVMDALLHNLVASTRLVENQQIIFLVVEGAALSFIAACYLTYLLRAVAAQRYKLYGTFLIIPLGLTRALATQNQNLNLGDDESDDDEDEDHTAQTPATVAQLPFGADDDNANDQRITRRAKLLRVQETEAPSVPVEGAVLDAAATREESSRTLASRRRAGPHPATTTGTNMTSDLRASRGVEDSSGHRSSRGRSTLSNGDLAEYDIAGCWSWLCTCWRKRVWRGLFKRLLRRRTSIVHPIPQHALAAGGFASLSEHAGAKRKLVLDSNETIILLLPFIVWSVLVITIYSVAVIKLKGIDNVVALHSVTNFMAARTSRSVFFSQELVSVDTAAQLPTKRAALLAAIKLVRDAWFTLQLGADAYLSAGNDTERFPLVTKGLVTSSPELLKLLYDTGTCHRTGEHLPCPGSDYRFFRIIYTSLASIAQQHMMSLKALATNTSMIPPGLQDENFDFIYNVGYTDLVDGALSLKEAYSDTIMAKFDVILLLHIILFLLFWLIIASFVVFQLNPLLRRISEERRRVAELMSQLPLELDVERLVRRVLMLGASTLSAAAVDAASVHEKSDLDATHRWKAIIRAGSSLNSKAPSMDGSYRKKG